MLSDCLLPPGLAADAFDIQTCRGIAYASARYSPAGVSRVIEHLERHGPAALDRVPPARCLEVWESLIEDLLDPGNPLRLQLDPALSRLTGLAPKSLAAALENLLQGVVGPAARRMADRAQKASDRSPVAILLAGNLPGLALQALLPPLLVGRPVLIKTPSSEPLFTPALATELVRRESTLADALAVLTWKGGDDQLERPVFETAGRVVAYGDQPAIDEVRRHVGDRLVALGPGISLAIVAADIDPREIAQGLARDIALFDQRGCLSVHAIYTNGNAEALADALAEALRDLATSLPPGPLDPLLATSVQQLRMQADLRALHRPDQPLATGTVVVEPLPELQASPGLRSVRIHPLQDLETIPKLLDPWRGRLQGVALAGPPAWKLESRLSALGCSRFSPPGELQKTDFDWWNAGRPPLEIFGGSVLAD